MIQENKQQKRARIPQSQNLAAAKNLRTKHPKVKQVQRRSGTLRPEIVYVVRSARVLALPVVQSA